MSQPFINPDITAEYEPLGGSAHLIVNAGGNIDHIDISQTAALEHCQTENLLPIKEFDCIQLKIRYDVSNKISLSEDVFKRRKIIRREFIELVLGIINAVEEISSYNTLTNAGLLYDARYIFVDSVSLKPAMVYLPVYKNIADLSEFRNFIRSLFAYLKTDGVQDDFSTVILDNINQEPFMLRAFKETISAFKEHEKVPENTAQKDSQEPVPSEVKAIAPPLPSIVPNIYTIPVRPSAEEPPYPLRAPRITPKKHRKYSARTLITFAAVSIALVLIAVLLVLSGVFIASNGVGIDFFSIAVAVSILASIEFIAIRILLVNGHNIERIITTPQTPTHIPLSSPFGTCEDSVLGYDTKTVNIGTIDDTEINDSAEGLGWGRLEYPYLEHIVNSSPVKVYIDKKSFILGRDPAGCDYVCADDEVSRKHAEVITRGSELYIKEIKARNHTYLSRAKQSALTPLQLDPSEEYRLFANDIVWLGKNTALTVKGIYSNTE